MTETSNTDNIQIPNYKTFVQIDLETLSLKQHTCPVLTLGACAYSYPHGIFETFKLTFELDEQFKNGRMPNEDTLMWWITQSQEAKNGLLGATKSSIIEAEELLHDWWTFKVMLGDQQPYVLSHGANFDIAILEILFDNVPWHYKHTMCFRTLTTLYKGHYEWRTDSVKHDALEDAKAQADIHLQLMEKFEILR